MATKAADKNTTKRKERLDFRLSFENKLIIEEAAMISEQSVSDFVLSITLPAARRRISQANITRLSDRDRDLFLAMLDDESGPSQALKDDFEEYQNYLKARAEKK